MGSGICGTQQDHDTHEFIAAEVPFSTVASPPMEMLPVWGADNQCLKKERQSVFFKDVSLGLSTIL